jgi:hypothetical protein
MSELDDTKQTSSFSSEYKHTNVCNKRLDRRHRKVMSLRERRNREHDNRRSKAVECSKNKVTAKDQERLNALLMSFKDTQDEKCIESSLMELNKFIQTYSESNLTPLITHEAKPILRVVGLLKHANESIARRAIVTCGTMTYTNCLVSAILNIDLLNALESFLDSYGTNSDMISDVCLVLTNVMLTSDHDAQRVIDSGVPEKVLKFTNSSWEDTHLLSLSNMVHTICLKNLNLDQVRPFVQFSRKMVMEHNSTIVAGRFIACLHAFVCTYDYDISPAPYKITFDMPVFTRLVELLQNCHDIIMKILHALTMCADHFSRLLCRTDFVSHVCNLIEWGPDTCVMSLFTLSNCMIDVDGFARVVMEHPSNIVDKLITLVRQYHTFQISEAAWHACFVFFSRAISICGREDCVNRILKADMIHIVLSKLPEESSAEQRSDMLDILLLIFESVYEMAESHASNSIPFERACEEFQSSNGYSVISDIMDSLHVHASTLSDTSSQLYEKCSTLLQYAEINDFVLTLDEGVDQDDQKDEPFTF